MVVDTADYSREQAVCTNDYLIYFTTYKSFKVRSLSSSASSSGFSYSSEQDFILLGIRGDILYIGYKDGISCLNLNTRKEEKKLPISLNDVRYYKEGLGNDFKITDTLLISNANGLYKIMIN